MQKEEGPMNLSFEDLEMQKRVEEKIESLA